MTIHSTHGFSHLLLLLLLLKYKIVCFNILNKNIFLNLIIAYQNASRDIKAALFFSFLWKGGIHLILVFDKSNIH